MSRGPLPRSKYQPTHVSYFWTVKQSSVLGLPAGRSHFPEDFVNIEEMQKFQQEFPGKSYFVNGGGLLSRRCTENNAPWVSECSVLLAGGLWSPPLSLCWRGGRGGVGRDGEA